MVRVKSSQKSFTEEEVARLTGICREHVRRFARDKHVGTITRVAEMVGADTWTFTHSELMILAVLQPRCQH